MLNVFVAIEIDCSKQKWNSFSSFYCAHIKPDRISKIVRCRGKQSEMKIESARRQNGHLVGGRQLAGLICSALVLNVKSNQMALSERKRAGRAS